MLRYVAPWLMLGTTFYAFMREFVYTRLFFRMKDDLRSTIRKERILSNIVKVLPIKSTENQAVTVGLIICNRESNQTVRYYLLARDVWIERKVDRQALNHQKLNIVYLEKSRLIVNDEYRKIIKMTLRKEE